jgi:hypothetical protein
MMKVYVLSLLILLTTALYGRFVIYDQVPILLNPAYPVCPDSLQFIDEDPVFDAHVTESGVVDSFYFLERAHPVIDSIAVSVLKTMKFAPATTYNIPIECWVTFPIAFLRQKKHPQLMSEEHFMIPDSLRSLKSKFVYTLNILEDGSIKEIIVTKSDNDQLCDFFKEKLLRWQYYPAFKNTKPIDSWLRVEITVSDEYMQNYIIEWEDD